MPPLKQRTLPGLSNIISKGNWDERIARVPSVPQFNFSFMWGAANISVFMIRWQWSLRARPSDEKPSPREARENETHLCRRDVSRFRPEGRCSWTPGHLQRDPPDGLWAVWGSRTGQCLITWVGGGPECPKVVKEMLYPPVFLEVCVDLSHWGWGLNSVPLQMMTHWR